MNSIPTITRLVIGKQGGAPFVWAPMSSRAPVFSIVIPSATACPPVTWPLSGGEEAVSGGGTDRPALSLLYFMSR